VADWHRLADEELARRGRHLVRHGHYSLGAELLSEYCSRMIARDRPIGASVMAFYGLAVGMTGNLQEGLATCQRALSIDRRSPDIWTALARLALFSGDRKKACDAVARGLALSPHHTELGEVSQFLGIRRRPAVPFLSRTNPVNVRLGQVLQRLVGRAKTSA